ncbi:MAG: hypothetical protein JWL60_2516 [Gemmatimonadetes bacterium]|nr:hypothetical protein [Gemmatimonadota bacterium]
MTRIAFLPTLAALLAAAGSAGAQSALDGELRLAPQFQQYRLAAPTDETIAQLVLPVFLTMPFGPRFSMDVGTAYARARVVSSAGVSQVEGLTDTQVRGNLTLGSDFVVITAGLNLPTGQRSVTLEQFTAASRMGSDFLAFPISNMGTGFAATGGVAVARPLGDWSVGAGAAMRRSQEYEPFNIPNQSLAFRPGNEYRLRLGADRAAGRGRLALGLTYSAFGQDDAAGSRYNVGDRIIGQGAYSTTRAGTDLVFAAYDVFRRAGSYASGERAGSENIANLFMSAGMQRGGRLLEPSVELRHWLQRVPAPGVAVGERRQSSVLATLGLRTRLALAGVTTYPGVGMTLGSLATRTATGEPEKAGITGFRAQVAMRASPFAR